MTGHDEAGREAEQVRRDQPLPWPPASVTGLVDRLERRGYLRRVPHPTDKRRVLIELCDQPVGTELVPLFEDWAREVHSHYEDFSTEELETVIRFLRGSTARQRALAARLDAE
ncbi:MarR family winged helix-turn-helix transcriptional regulator [Nocardia niigatensis]